MQMNPYLMFNGDCHEAFEFYAQVLGGKITMLSRYGDAPNGSGDPAPESRDKIMHARLEFGGQVLMGSDACPPQYAYEGIKGCSVALNAGDIAEAERIFNALTDRADVQMPLQKTFWAERFGMLVDRFGVPWMINCVQSG